MKVLLSAYACEPHAGSEPGVGFGALKAAASEHDVWLLTRENNVPALRVWLRDSGLDQRVHLLGLDIPGSALARKKKGLMSLHRYYDLWQRAAGDIGRELHATVRFDVVHHATFASYWTRTGVASVPAPLVWGPVGGGVPTPVGLLPTLGMKGLLEEAARTMGRRLGAIRHGATKTAARAAVTLAQNRETAYRLGGPGRRVRLVPNATVVEETPRPPPGKRTAEVYLAGRLVPLKASVLAVRAFQYVEHSAASLVIVGDGPDKSRILRAAKRFQVEERVMLEGHLARDELLDRIARCGVLLHPSLHDESPLTVAEALGLGTPVVCLDWGGPAVLTSLWPSTPSTLVAPTTPDDTARRLAAAIDDHLTHPPEMSTTWRQSAVSFESELRAAYHRAAKADPTKWIPGRG